MHPRREYVCVCAHVRMIGIYGGGAGGGGSNKSMRCCEPTTNTAIGTALEDSHCINTSIHNLNCTNLKSHSSGKTK